MRETVTRLLGRVARPPLVASGGQARERQGGGADSGAIGDDDNAADPVPGLRSAQRGNAAWLRGLRQLAGAPLGWVVTAVGAALLVVGWYGISGESVVAKQLPYLASATIPGAALLVAGLLMAARAQPGERDRQLLADLHAALLEPAPAPEAPTDGGLWATPKGSTYHRAGCALARQGATRVTDAQVRERGLEPCPVCEPDR